MRSVHLLSTEPDTLIQGVAAELAEKEGCRKRGLWRAAEALGISAATMRSYLAGLRRPSPRVAEAARALGRQLAMERAARMAAELAELHRLIEEEADALSTPLARGQDMAALGAALHPPRQVVRAERANGAHNDDAPAGALRA